MSMFSYYPYDDPEASILVTLLVWGAVLGFIAIVMVVAYYGEIIPSANAATFSAELRAKGFTIEENVYLSKSLTVTTLNSVDAFYQKAIELNTTTAYKLHDAHVYYLINREGTLAWGYYP